MEHSALRSKKFVAWLVGHLTLCAALLLAIWRDGGALVPVQIALTIVVGFLDVGYVLGQSYIDRYVRVAAIAVGQREQDDGAAG